MKKKVMSLTLGLLFALQMLLPCGLAFAAGAPSVTAVTPSGDAVLKAAIGSVSFDVNMDRATLTSANIVVTDVTNGNSVVEQRKSSAYDRAYTFICDFQPNTTYRVTVSTAVQSVEGVALAETYTHTFTTGAALIPLENATPQDATNYTHNAGTHCSGTNSNAKLIDVFDRNPLTKWYTYGDPMGKWVKIDLGKAVDIAYISYIPGSGWGAPSWASEISVSVSNDADFANATELAVTPTLTESDPYDAIEWTVASTDAETYRYVKIYKNSKNITLAEVAVYAYASCPEVVSVTPQGDSVQKAAAAKVTFDSLMDRATLTSENITVTNVTNGGTVVPQSKASAYDKAYAFVCDFQPNTTYCITVSTAVQSAAGVPLDAAYTHTFTTGEYLFGAGNIAPRDTAKYSHNSPNTSGSISCVYDGGYRDIWNTFGGSAPKYLQVDLGEARSLAYISYFGQRANDDDSFTSEMKILVSNDESFATYSELAMTPTQPSGVKTGILEWIAVNETAEAYRYARVQKDGKVIYVSELAVYAYENQPTVSSMSFGADGAQDVRYAKMMKIDFDSVMNRFSMTADTIVVTDSQGNVVPQTDSCAFDQSYVFSCNFKSNSTYTVTVTTGVKGLGGTPIAEAVAYSFTTGYVAPVKNVTPQNDAAYSSSTGEFRGKYGGARAIYTGGPNDETYDYLPNGEVAWIQTDLGQEMPIAYISFLPRNTGLTPEQFRGDMRGGDILVSNDPTFATYEKLDNVPGYYENEPAQKGIYWKYVTQTPGASYRYVRVQRTSYVFISELTVYAYQNPIEIKSTNEITQIAKTDEYGIQYYGIWGDLAAGGSVSFVAEVTSESAQTANVKTYAAVYGEDADGVKHVVAVSCAAAGEPTAIDIPQGITNAEVKLFIVTNDLTPLVVSIVK